MERIFWTNPQYLCQSKACIQKLYNSVFNCCKFQANIVEEIAIFDDTETVLVHLMHLRCHFKYRGQLNTSRQIYNNFCWGFYILLKFVKSQNSLAHFQPCTTNHQELSHSMSLNICRLHEAGSSNCIWFDTTHTHPSLNICYKNLMPSVQGQCEWHLLICYIMFFCDFFHVPGDSSKCGQ